MTFYKTNAMKFLCSVQSVILVLTLALPLSIVGCTGNGANSSPTPRSVGTFTGQDLPELVEELEGTPLYSESVRLTPLAKTDDAVYLLIAPQDPLKALLILEEGAVPEDVALRKSEIVKLAGKRDSLKNEALVAHVKEQYQLDLKTNESGEVLVLRVVAGDSPATTASPAPGQSTPLPASTPAVSIPEPAATPTASISEPAATATPATEQTPQDESTTNVE